MSSRVYNVTEQLQTQLDNASGKNATMQTLVGNAIVTVLNKSFEEQETPRLHPEFTGTTADFSTREWRILKGICPASVVGADVIGVDIYAESYTFVNNAPVFSGTKELIGRYNANTQIELQYIVTIGRYRLFYKIVAENIYGTHYSDYYPINVRFGCVYHVREGTQTLAMTGYNDTGSDWGLNITHGITTQYRGIKSNTAIDEALLVYASPYYPRRLNGFSSNNEFKFVPIELTVTDASQAKLYYSRDTTFKENTLVPYQYHYDNSEMPIYALTPNKAVTEQYTYKSHTDYFCNTLAGTFAFFGSDKTDPNKVYLYVNTNIALESVDEENTNALDVWQGEEGTPRVRVYMTTTLQSPRYNTGTEWGDSLNYSIVNGWWKIDVSNYITNFNTCTRLQYVTNTETTDVTNLYPQYSMREVCPTYGIRVIPDTPYTDIDGAVCPNTFTNDSSDDDKKPDPEPEPKPEPEDTTNKAVKTRRKTGK